MLTNDSMRANRYGKWAAARHTISMIQTALASGHTVIVATYTKATQFNKPSHAAMFKATRSGAYMQRGKHWDCIDYSSIKVYRRVSK